MTFAKVRRYHCFEVRVDGSFVKPLLREEPTPGAEIVEGELSKRLFGSLKIKRNWSERLLSRIIT